jgi:hypothetical protein
MYRPRDSIIASSIESSSIFIWKKKTIGSDKSDIAGDLSFNIESADVISKSGLFIAGIFFLAKGAVYIDRW